jgi:hypothetical protein
MRHKKRISFSELVISANRGEDHPKGAKHITTVVNGGKIEPGVIIGKGTYLRIKQRNFYTNGVIEVVEWPVKKRRW